MKDSFIGGSQPSSWAVWCFRDSNSIQRLFPFLVYIFFLATVSNDGEDSSFNSSKWPNGSYVSMEWDIVIVFD